MNGLVNYPTDPESEQLALLSGECGEVVHAIANVNRHGFDSRWPKPDGPSNTQMLEDEIGHVLAAVDIMVARGTLDLARIAASRVAKLSGVQQWLHCESNVAAARDVVANVTASKDASPELEVMRDLIASARKDFRDKAAQILRDADNETKDFADALERAIGEISSSDAVTALRNFKAGDRNIRKQLTDVNGAS